MSESLSENVTAGLWPAAEGWHLGARKNQRVGLNRPGLQGFLADDAFSAGLEAATLRQPRWPTLHFQTDVYGFFNR